VRNNIDSSCEEIIFKRFPGGTAEEMAHYAIKPLTDVRPDQVVVISGTNDLTRAMYDGGGHVNEYEIAENILKIGRTARENGATKIFISGILPRWGHQFRNGIMRLNNLLQSRCSEEGFLYMDLSDITAAHISGDGVHLNYHGSTILKMNILLLFNYFNPYLWSFGEEYENAMF
jgi:hypothetical protein